MRLREIPAYPPLFVDFVENSWVGDPLLPGPPTVDSLAARARVIGQGRALGVELAQKLAGQAEEFGAGPPAMRNLRRLRENDAVAVVATLHGDLFGGPLSVLLKSLCAIRLAAELQDQGFSAVPVCWISPFEANGNHTRLSVNLLDSDSRPKNFSLDDDVTSSDDLRLPDYVESLIAQIAGMAEGVQVDEILGILSKCYVPGIPLSRAMGRFLTTLLEEWGPVIVDSTEVGFKALADQVPDRLGIQPERLWARIVDHYSKLEPLGYYSFPRPKPGDRALLSPLVKESLLPVAAHVADANELPRFALIQPLFRDTKMPEPVIWPRAGATILDARSRKILGKYSVRLEDLLAGQDPGMAVLSLYEDAGRRAIAEFDAMLEELDRRLNELAVFFASQAEVKGSVNSAYEKLKYQIARLRERFATGARTRNEAVGRQIERACATLAPKGRLQEEELGGLHFLLRYSLSFLQILYQKLDITRFEHQAIAVD